MVVYVRDLFGKYTDTVTNNTWIIIEIPAKLKYLFINNLKIDIKLFPQFELDKKKNLLYKIHKDTEIKIKKIINVGNKYIETVEDEVLNNIKIGKKKYQFIFTVIHYLLKDTDLDKNKLETVTKYIIEMKDVFSNDEESKKKIIELIEIINTKEIEKIKSAKIFLDYSCVENYYSSRPDLNDKKEIINIDKININRTIEIKKDETELFTKEDNDIETKEDNDIETKEDNDIKLPVTKIKKNIKKENTNLLISFKIKCWKFFSIIYNYLVKIPLFGILF